MDCEVHWIGCQLSEIAEKIGQPTGWEIAGVLVAGVAALGTLWIGTLNLVLLKKQSSIVAAQHAQQERDQRFTHTMALLDEFSLRVAMPPGLSSADDMARNNASLKLTGDAIRQDFVNGSEMTSWVLGQGDALNPEHERVLEVSQIVGNVALAWAEDPHSYEKVADLL